MKKLAILSVTLLFILAYGQTFAQEANNDANSISKKEKRIERKGDRKELRKLLGDRVSEISLKSFKSDFGDIADVKWVRTVNYDEATFTRDNHIYTAYYDADGELVGTTSPKSLKELPIKGQKNLQTKYKNYAVGEIIYFDNNVINRTPMILWGSEVNDISNYFVELKKGAKKMVVYMDVKGNVSFFKEL
ncbi:MAG: hypothetical protein Q8908_10030 [Bacteroidota bacterium]|nr:hypothetical protein [Bacteroidota bacterium]